MRLKKGTPSGGSGEVVSTRSGKLVVLHWLTLFCVVSGVVLILIRDEVAGRATRQWLLDGHRHAGVLVLLLFVARVALRIRSGKLSPTGDPSRLARIAATLVHAALYALLLALPVLGWALNDALGKPAHLLGVALPALVRADEDLADTLLAWHQDAAWLLLGLVLLHAAAALWHHFVLRDGVLRTMFPKPRR
jgi:cytochrome b561